MNKPKTSTPPFYGLLSAILLLPLAACQPKTLAVRPAEPLPAPKIEVPEFLMRCPPIPSWLVSALPKCEDGAN